MLKVKVRLVFHIDFTLLSWLFTGHRYQAGTIDYYLTKITGAKGHLAVKVVGLFSHFKYSRKREQLGSLSIQ